MQNAIEIELQGEVPSKKNSYRRGRSGRFYIAREVADLIDDLHLQLNTAHKRPRSPLRGPLRVTVSIFDNGRRDPDNQKTTLLDLLQKSGFIKNDREVVESTVRRKKIAGLPYAEIKIEVIPS